MFIFFLSTLLLHPFIYSTVSQVGAWLSLSWAMHALMVAFRRVWARQHQNWWLCRSPGLFLDIDGGVVGGEKGIW
jgi:hypothetical protein